MHLLRQYADGHSDLAFATLVSRHVNLVYSAALRRTGHPDAAEEITQAVFIILAQKAGRISDKTILSGWLYQTTRFTAASFLKAQTRRVRREHEAYMQNELRTAASDETWTQLAPLLEDAMGQLNAKERSAVVLRFFDDKSFAEVAMAFGVSENAAKKRVGRALEKLHRYFSKRGVSSTAATIAASLSANSVQAAPATLAITANTVAIPKGTTASSSTLTLVKSALKLMTYTKLKTTALIGLGILIAAGTVVTTREISSRNQAIQTQKLPDGSILSLEGVKIGHNNEFVRGPAKNKYRQPDTLTTCFTAEFKLSGASPDNVLVSRSMTQQRRAVVSGEDGLEYVNIFYFLDRYDNDYFGDLNTCLFPRDSSRLRIQIQQRDALDAPWRTIADFTHRQRPSHEEEWWQPEQGPVSRNADGMQVSIDEVTLQLGTDPIQESGTPFWNRTVTIPWRISGGGVVITNWTLLDLILRDSSGNAEHVGSTDGITDILASSSGDVYGEHHAGAFQSVTNGWMVTEAWQSPDPRKVWKIQAQVAEKSGFAQSNIFTLRIPLGGASSFDTDLGGYPFRIEFLQRQWVSTKLLLTNRTDLRLNYLHAEDQDGEKIYWNTHRTQFGFVMLIDTRAGGELVETFAVGRNIPIEFVTKPRLIRSSLPSSRL